jgi:hypothetical protein
VPRCVCLRQFSGRWPVKGWFERQYSSSFILSGTRSIKRLGISSSTTLYYSSAGVPILV